MKRSTIRDLAAATVVLSVIAVVRCGSSLEQVRIAEPRNVPGGIAFPSKFDRAEA